MTETDLTPSNDVSSTPASNTRRIGPWAVAGILMLLLFLGGIGYTVYTLIFQPANVAILRDVVIIFLAFEAMLIGFVLVLLVIQIARLTTVIQDEVKPILDSTHETVSTLRGTSKFLSNNLVSPVMKASSSLSAVRQALNWLGLNRRKQ